MWKPAVSICCVMFSMFSMFIEFYLKYMIVCAIIFRYIFRKGDFNNE